MTRELRVIALVVLLVPGCSKGKKGAQGACACTGNTSCAAGAICVANTCRALCNADNDCARATCGASQQYCDNGACVDGKRSGAPSITAVNGNGSPLPIVGDTSGGQPAPNRLRQELVITGTGLSGCAVTLANGDTSRPLPVASASDTQIIATLPQDVENDTDHHYMLSVVNGAGSDQSGVWILQGEPGATGPMPDASQLQTMLAGVSDLGCNGCVSTTDLAPGAMASSGNYIPNGDFAHGTPPVAWTFDSSVAEQTSTGGGGFAMQNLPDGGSYKRAVITSDVWAPVHQSATYRVWGSFMIAAQPFQVGQYILAVRLRDNTGAEIPGPNGDPYWWSALVGPNPSSNPTTGTWVNSSTVFGFGTAQPLPAGVKDASVAIILNDSNTNPGTAGGRQFQVQGVGFFNLSGAWEPDVSNDVSYTSGNVGIGTSTPATLLDVNGDSHVAGDDTIDGTAHIGTSLCIGSSCITNVKYQELRVINAVCPNAGITTTTVSCANTRRYVSNTCTSTSTITTNNWAKTCAGGCVGRTSAPATCTNPSLGYLVGP